MKKRIINFLVIIFFFSGVIFFIQKNLVGYSALTIGGIQVPLRYDLLIAMIVVNILGFILFHFLKPLIAARHEKKFSILQCIIFLWILTVLTCYGALSLTGFSFSEIILQGCSIILKITSIYLIYSAWTFLLFGAGTEILSRFRIEPSDFFTRFLASLAAAFILTAYFFYAASLAYSVSWLTMTAYIFLLAILSLRHYRSHFKEVLKPRFSIAVSSKTAAFLNLFILTLAVIWFAVMFMSLPLPHPVGGDDVRTYYEIPRTIIAQHGIVAFPYYSFNNAPHAASYLYVPLLFLGGFILNYLNLFFFILTLFAVYCIGRSVSKQVALWSSLFWAAPPFHYWFIITAKVDYIEVFFVLIMLRFLLLIKKEGNARLFAFAGACFGFAVSIKFTALLLVAPLVVVLLWFFHFKSVQKKFMIISIFFLFSFVIFLPWGIRNYALFGNPLYPFSLISAHREMSVLSEAYKRTTFFFDELHSRFVHGVSLSYPWYVNFWNIYVGRSTYPANALGPFVFALLPLGVAALFASPGALLATLVLGTGFLWYWSSLQQIWYILYVFPFIALMYALGAQFLFRWVRGTIIFSVLLFIIMTLNVSRISLVRYFLPEYGVQTVVEAQNFTELTEYLNDQLRIQDDKYVLFNFSGGGAYNAYIADSYKHIYVDTSKFNNALIYVERQRTDELLSAMKDAGITYLLYSAESDAYWRRNYCDFSTQNLCFTSAVRENFETLLPHLTEIHHAADNQWSVYKINYVQ